MNPIQTPPELEVERAKPGATVRGARLEPGVPSTGDKPRPGPSRGRRWLLPGRRPWLLAFVAGTLVAFAAAAAGLAVYEYTESATFCAYTCHPMGPQGTVFQQQVHANISCATCHVGHGLEHFLRSKLNGSRQALDYVTNSYHRPVPSPIKDLRPARETCETCHRPEKFTDNVIKLRTHFEEDQANTPTSTLLVLKMGGYDSIGGQNKGIHWHIKSEVYYVAADDQRQEMKYVGVKGEDGKLTEYWSPDLSMLQGSDFVAEAKAEGRLRRLDCIDCHNRAAHLIEPPEILVDKSLAAGTLDRSLPYLKKESVELLSGDYPDQEAGVAAMAALEGFYRTRYPEVYQQNREAIKTAVARLQEIYRKTNFPDMKLNWQTYPNNVNHRDFKGCSRCHDDKLRRFDEQGRVAGKISGACNLCHSVPVITRSGGPEARIEPTLGPKGLEYLVRDASGAILASVDSSKSIDLTKPGQVKIVAAPLVPPAADRALSSRARSTNVSLVGPPLVALPLPESHRDPKYSLTHRDISEQERATCARCHTDKAGAASGSYCQSCHDNSPPHPPDILFTHPRVIQAEQGKGGLDCSTCHQQNVSCARCHAGDVVGARGQAASRPAPRGPS